MDTKISIIGAGYVGTSLGVLISSKYNVTLYDLDKHKVDLINNKESHLEEQDISDWLTKKKLSISATTNPEEALKGADLYIICTPTNFDSKTNSFNTESVTQSIKKILKINKKAKILIKSTIPIGYTQQIIKKTRHKAIAFSPEFLREGSSLQDNLYPARIIISDNHMGLANLFADIMQNLILVKKPEIIFMAPSEAETVKLFSNTYLAMRVSFFNELDNFALSRDLNPKNLIDGISSDPRIGKQYNNPSFGFGGYCLPKDLKQLNSNFGDIPHSLIASIDRSNKARAEFIASDILAKKVKKIGFYRLAMKKDSDNFRASSVLMLMKAILKSSNKCQIFLFEPSISKTPLKNVSLISHFNEFHKKSELIICNREDKKISKKKMYTRDIYNRDL